MTPYSVELSSFDEDVVKLFQTSFGNDVFSIAKGCYSRVPRLFLQHRTKLTTAANRQMNAITSERANEHVTVEIMRTLSLDSKPIVTELEFRNTIFAVLRFALRHEG